MNILHDSLKPKKRDLFLSGTVTEASVLELSKQILDINRSDAEIKSVVEGSGFKYESPPIKLFIDSPGGYVSTGLGLISLIECSSTPIVTICTGMAASMGALILMSGHKRLCLPRSTIMIHQLSAGTMGTLQDMDERTAYLKSVQERLEGIILARTKISKQRIKEIREKKQDAYYTADEALKLKIVDMIVDSI